MEIADHPEAVKKIIGESGMYFKHFAHKKTVSHIHNEFIQFMWLLENNEIVYPTTLKMQQNYLTGDFITLSSSMDNIKIVDNIIDFGKYRDQDLLRNIKISVFESKTINKINYNDINKFNRILNLIELNNILTGIEFDKKILLRANYIPSDVILDNNIVDISMFELENININNIQSKIDEHEYIFNNYSHVLRDGVNLLMKSRK